MKRIRKAKAQSSRCLEKMLKTKKNEFFKARLRIRRIKPR